MTRPIYFDYAATTPVDPKVAKVMNQYLTSDGQYGNPASRSHWYGWQAEEAIEEARCQLADLLCCDSREIVWTSGATEANNLAIKGTLEANPGRGRHLITSMTEHMAVLDPIAYLEARAGYEVTRLQPDAQGCLTAEQLQAALRPDTALVSLMHVNNETGSINPVAEMAAVTEAAGVLLHVDAAQSLGKLPIDLHKLPVDLMSFSAHKIYGPKGVGALYLRRRGGVPVVAQIHGGGHERGMRSGTLPTHQIAGMGQAARLCTSPAQGILAELDRIRELRTTFLDGLATVAGQFRINGVSDAPGSYPGILSLTFPALDVESMLMALAPDLAASNGSACTSVKIEPSHVLQAMGLDNQSALNSIRFSFGRFTTEDDVVRGAERVQTVVKALATS